MATAKAAPAAQRPSDGYVLADALYTLPALKNEVGLGKSALRQARRQGLKVRMIGRKGFVLGADIIKFVVDAGK